MNAVVGEVLNRAGRERDLRRMLGPEGWARRQAALAAWDEGKATRKAGKPRNSHRHPPGGELAGMWERGYDGVGDYED